MLPEIVSQIEVGPRLEMNLKSALEITVELNRRAAVKQDAMAAAVRSHMKPLPSKVETAGGRVLKKLKESAGQD
jgi:hypothetical protein